METGKFVKLIDGREVDSGSEPWRHECEARHIAKLPDQAARHDYLAKVRERRGAAAGNALEELATKIYAAERPSQQGKG